MNESWSNSYIGILFRPCGRARDGLDCYGLLRLVYADQLGVLLPSYDEPYVTTEERGEIERLIAGERRAPQWIDIARGTERAFDVALCSVAGFVSHVGVVVAPGMMLHADEWQGVKIVRYGEGLCRARVSGFLRHATREER